MIRTRAFAAALIVAGVTFLSVTSASASSSITAPNPVPPPTNCTTTCYVDGATGSDANTGASALTAFKTIQKAIDTVQAGGTVRVLPGSYSEAATNRYVLGTANGPHQFGLFFTKDKPGISVIGVTSGDVPITNAAGTLANITTNATNNFGYSGIFVEGDGVTITGVNILPNAGGDNKTIEVLGDGFTFKNAKISVYQGAIYFGDERYITTTNTSHIQTYDISNNLFLSGTRVTVNSGAGVTGVVSGRKIQNNVFQPAPNQDWPSINFSGAGGYAWYVNPVGGAVITGNTFSGSTQYIRARGDYLNAQFDWASFWNNNTFDKAVVTLIGAYPPFDVRPYTYDVFTNVRRIGAVIQPDVEIAQTNDTVLVKAATYPEQVIITKTLSLIGENQATTFIKPPASLIGDAIGAALVSITNTAQVTMTGFTVAGPKDPPLTCDPAGALTYGVRVMGNGALNLSDSAVIDIRDNPLSGCQTGIAVRAGSYSFNEAGHLVMSNVVITGYQKGGIVISGPGSSGILNSNIITGYGNQTHIAANSVQISGGAIATVTGNTISANKCDLAGICTSDPITGTFSSGVLLYDAGAVVLTGNIISDTDAGIYSYAPTTPAVIEGNTLLNNRWHGIYIDEGNTTAQSNTISGSLNGVVVASYLANAGNSNAKVYSNTISGATNGLLVVDESITDTNKPVLDAQYNNLNSNTNGVLMNASAPAASSSVQRNNLIGNTTGISNAAPSTLNATFNWWNAANGPGPIAKGSGDKVSANVTYCPWLTSAAPGGAAFYPVWNVTTNKGFCSIQAAIDDSDTVNGNVISVTAGIYTESVVVNKELTLRGAQVGQSANTRVAAFAAGKANPAVETILYPIASNPTAGNPGAIDLIRVLSNNVTLDGFVLDGNNPALGSSSVVMDGVAAHARRGLTNISSDDNFNPVNNLVVRNNIFQNFGQRGISLANNGPASTGNRIEQNVFRRVSDQAVILFTGAYADVLTNTISVPVDGIGLHLQNFFTDGSMTWRANDVTVLTGSLGIHANMLYNTPNARLTIDSNTVKAAPGVALDDYTWGINVWSVQNGPTVVVTNNVVGASGGQLGRGINVWNVPTANTVEVAGGSIHNSAIGINLDNIDPYYGAGATSALSITNVVITGATGTTGVQVRVAPLAVSPYYGSNIPGGSAQAFIRQTQITGADIGVMVLTNNAGVYGASASVAGSTLQNNKVGVQASNATVTATNNTISGSTTAGLYSTGTSPVLSATLNTLQNNGKGLLNDAPITMMSMMSAQSMEAAPSPNPRLAPADDLGNPSPTPPQGRESRTNALAAPVNLGSPKPSVAANYNSITGNTLYGMENAGSGTLDATFNWWNAANGPSSIAAGSGDKVSTNVTYCPWLTSAAPGGAAFYPVWNVTTNKGYCSIQAAIDDVTTVAGNTISVTAGVYTETVNINKSNLTLIGASGAAATTIVGPKSGASNDTVLFSAPGVTVDGFTITRDGNNPTDWPANVRNQGVNMASTGGTLKNSIITGNRNAVLITYDDTKVISNNIVNNRTGIHIQGQAQNVTITNNIITGNWTIGILFRQNASNNAGWLIQHNRITDNWYAQLEDRGNPSGLTRTIESNYWGVSPFSITISNTAGEPGYASQIPVQFGGSAVPPASAPIFIVNALDPNPNGDTGGRGNANTARLDFDPWLCDGTDTAPAIGFQPNTANLCDGTPPNTFISSAPISPTASTSATFVFSGTDTITPEPNLTFQCSLNGGAFSTCASPKTYSGLSDGLNTFAVRAKDPDGNVDPTPATHAWFVDATASDTTITSAPISPTNVTTSVFTFTGNDGSGVGVASFECKLNAGAWSACSSPITYTSGLSEGLNTFAVRAIDALSNTDASPATHTWTMDTTGPDTTITSSPALTTSAPYATFAFTGNDGSGTGVVSFECRLDSGAWAACNSPQTYTGIANGNHTFAVKALDAVGNPDPTPASYTWLVDLVAPVTSITSAPASPTSTTSATIVFSGTDAGGSGIAYFEYRLNGSAWLSTTNTSISYTGLGNGTQQFDVRAVDKVGNVDLAYATTSWIIDAVKPDTSITSAPASLVLTSTATFVFTGTDAGGSGLAYFSYTLDGGAPLTTTSTTLTFTSLSEGPHTFAVAAVDAVGNVDATPATATWTVDTLAPETTITISPTTPTSNTAATIAFTGSDAGSGVASFKCSLDGATPAACISPVNQSSLANGSHTFAVFAIDNVGNADPTPASVTWVVDATPPDTQITSSPASQTNTAAATFAFNGTDVGTGVAGFECQLNGGAWATCVSPKSYTSLSEGNNTFKVRALDVVSNVDATPASVTWLVDTTAPDSIITVAPAALISSTTASVTFTATDGTGSGVASFKCQLDSGTVAPCTSPTTLNSLTDGLHLFKVSAIDNVGNVETSPASTAFTVDATPPTTTIDTAPPAIDGSDASFTFSGGDGTGSGVAGFECRIDSGAWAACASPAAFLSLSGGSHTFDVRARDNAGNVDATPATHTWTVDVSLPNTTITSQPPAATNSTSASIVFTGTDSTTPVSGLTFECSFDGSMFSACTSPFNQSGLAQGQHTFAVRAIDDGGNIDPSPATATWLVDTAAPDTQITSAPPAITSSNSAVITFIGTDALVPASSLTFECSIDGGTFSTCTSPLALTNLPNGNHTVAVRAIDTAGNVDATPASTAWLVDATAPDTQITSQPANLTNMALATFAFSSTGSLSAVTYECRLDAGAWASCVTPNTIAGLSDGSHTFEVRATSAAGLTDATPASYTWTVDTTAPDTTITSAPPAISGDSVSFAFSGNDGSGSGVTSFECMLDSGAWAACTSPKSYAGLSNGNHTFRVRAIDNASNIDATPASQAWQVDTNLPDTLLTSTPPVVTQNTLASFSFIGSDDGFPSSALRYECKLDGGAWAACSSPANFTGLADGNHTFAVRDIDPGGNVDPTPASYTWTVDTIAPDTTITGGPSGLTTTTSATLTFIGSDALTAAGDLTFECRLNGGAWAACSSPAVLNALADGTQVFEVRAIDKAGNVDPTPATRTWSVKSTDIVLKLRLHLPLIFR